MNAESVIGLSDQVLGCLFDLDGVITRTATVHAAAWKEMFDAYLEKAAKRRYERTSCAVRTRRRQGNRREGTDRARV